MLQLQELNPKAADATRSHRLDGAARVPSHPSALQERTPALTPALPVGLALLNPGAHTHLPASPHPSSLSLLPSRRPVLGWSSWGPHGQAEAEEDEGAGAWRSSSLSPIPACVSDHVLRLKRSPLWETKPRLHSSLLGLTRAEPCREGNLSSSLPRAALSSRDSMLRGPTSVCANCPPSARVHSGPGDRESSLGLPPAAGGPPSPGLTPALTQRHVLPKPRANGEPEAAVAALGGGASLPPAVGAALFGRQQPCGASRRCSVTPSHTPYTLPVQSSSQCEGGGLVPGGSGSAGGCSSCRQLVPQLL